MASSWGGAPRLWLPRSHQQSLTRACAYCAELMEVNLVTDISSCPGRLAFLVPSKLKRPATVPASWRLAIRMNRITTAIAEPTARGTNTSFVPEGWQCVVSMGVAGC